MLLCCFFLCESGRIGSRSSQTATWFGFFDTVKTEPPAPLPPPSHTRANTRHTSPGGGASCLRNRKQECFIYPDGDQVCASDPCGDADPCSEGETCAVQESFPPVVVCFPEDEDACGGSCTEFQVSGRMGPGMPWGPPATAVAAGGVGQRFLLVPRLGTACAVFVVGAQALWHEHQTAIATGRHTSASRHELMQTRNLKNPRVF